MKYFSFYLILNIFLCYTGLGASVCYSRGSGVPDVSMNNCHESQPNEISSSKATANPYTITDVMNHQACVCYDAVLNAPHSHLVKNIVLYPLAFNIPILKNNAFPSFSLNLALKTQYRPSDLFLVNTSFLL